MFELFQEKLFHFWFNTFFVREEATIVPESKENGNDVERQERTRAPSYDEQAQIGQCDASRSVGLIVEVSCTG